jgi:hypothetical protein
MPVLLATLVAPLSSVLRLMRLLAISARELVLRSLPLVVRMPMRRLARLPPTSVPTLLRLLHTPVATTLLSPRLLLFLLPLLSLRLPPRTGCLLAPASHILPDIGHRTLWLSELILLEIGARIIRARAMRREVSQL